MFTLAVLLNSDFYVEVSAVLCAVGDVMIINTIFLIKLYRQIAKDKKKEEMTEILRQAKELVNSER